MASRDTGRAADGDKQHISRAPNKQETRDFIKNQAKDYDRCNELKTVPHVEDAIEAVMSGKIEQDEAVPAMVLAAYKKRNQGSLDAPPVADSSRSRDLETPDYMTHQALIDQLVTCDDFSLPQEEYLSNHNHRFSSEDGHAIYDAYKEGLELRNLDPNDHVKTYRSVYAKVKRRTDNW